MTTTVDSQASAPPPAWAVVVMAAMAGGMGWGIRGQFGHETGAMIAGVLVGSVLVFRFGRGADKVTALRAAALGAVAIGIGGSMTYGQTIGLTQNPPLVGNWAAWSWGMLGLGVKGAVWIGFAGLFFGMGFGGVRYTWRQMCGLTVAMGALYLVGAALLNSPYDPANKVLPRLYFSASWHWQPEAGPELKPRREVWGGLLFALLGAWVWAGWLRRDVLARRLALWGMLGGVGFPLGQCLQSWHAWQPEAFRGGGWAALAPHINWWNAMETTFGAVLGACLGLGLWLNRGLIRLRADPDLPGLGAPVEWVLVALHATLLLLGEFSSLRWANELYDPGLNLVCLPVVALAGGRLWPYWVLLPITLLPIAGKTIRRLAYANPGIGELAGWMWYGVLPLAGAALVARWLAKRDDFDGREAARWALLTNAWLYFGLNFAFFDFPWPWSAWTTRTPNALVFAGCAAGITLGCLRGRWRRVG